MSRRLVSVIMPSYNQGDYLAEALDSVLAQTYPDWECIVIDDGSTDNTREIVMSCSQKDARIRYLYQDNAGVVAARNRAIQESKGYYILPLDGDDKIAPEFLELAVKEIEKDRNIRVVYSEVQYFGARNDIYQLPPFSLERLLGQNILCITALFRREDFDKSGGFNENMKGGFEDWDFWLSMFKDGEGTAVKIPKVLFHYRIKPVSRNRISASKKDIDYGRIVWQNHKELYSKVYPDPRLSFAYLQKANSREYKLGYMILHPIKGYRNFIKKR